MLPDRKKAEHSSLALPVPLCEPEAGHGGMEGRLERDRESSALDPTPHTAGASSVPKTVTCWWPVSPPCKAKPNEGLSFTQLLLFLLSCTQCCHSSDRGGQQHQRWSSSISLHFPFTAFLWVFFFMPPPGYGTCQERMCSEVSARVVCTPLALSGSPSCARGREGTQRTSSR